MLHTNALTLRPVEERDLPLELWRRLSCVVHLLPHFRHDLVARHLNAPNPDDHLLCICQKQEPPCGLLLCRCAIRLFGAHSFPGPVFGIVLSARFACAKVMLPPLLWATGASCVLISTLPGT